jgi:hypothetical protein
VIYIFFTVFALVALDNVLFAWRICGGRGDLVKAHQLFGVLTLVINYSTTYVLASTATPLALPATSTHIVFGILALYLALLQTTISMASWIYAATCVKGAARYTYAALAAAALPPAIIYILSIETLKTLLPR